MLVIDGREIPTNEEGFLENPSDWNERVALALASLISLELTDAHFEIIHFLRDYHARFDHLPNNRMFVKAVQMSLGEAKGNSRYLHLLFPGSAVKWACFTAGLRKPPGCI